MSAILIAEDSSTHAALMRSILQGAGHDVECVENGRLAIESLEQALPDLVVTDLRMPEMNGMELVDAIASRHSGLPTVVVTARGSESLAVDALARGATNFVPKNSLGKLLNRVVSQTIRVAVADATYSDFPGRLKRPEFTFSLANEIPVIEPAILFVVQSLAASGHLNPTARIRVGTSVGCALFNAICFGNLEIRDDEQIISRFFADEGAWITEIHRRATSDEYRGRQVTLKVSIDHDDTRIAISHNGRGSMARMTPAPGTPESFELEQCRGTMLMTSFMDDVIYRSGASEVVMVKKH